MLPYAKEAQQDDDEIIPKHLANETTWYHWLLLNRPIKIIFLLLIFGILAPVLVYHFFFFTSIDLAPVDGLSLGSCLLPRTARLPCGLGNVSSEDCHPQCCYDISLNFCFHRFPSRFSLIVADNWTEEAILTPRVTTVPFGQNSLPQIKLSIDEITSTHLSMQFYNPQLATIEGNRLDNKEYTYKVSGPELHINVTTKYGAIFDSKRGPLIASNNIWEMSFKLTNETMFGLGEIPLEEGTTKVLYNHDGGISSVPLIFAKLNESYHGLLIDVKDPTEITIHGENNIVVRSITKLGLKFHLFVGPEPKDIMRDVKNLIGFKNELDYWMLGAHICSELPISEDTTAMDDLNSFLDEAAEANLPYDSHCGLRPIELNDDDCEPIDDNVDIAGNAVKARNKRYVPLVSPYLLYDHYAPENETSQENKTSKGNCSIASKYESLMLQTIQRVNVNGSTIEVRELYKGLVQNRTVIYPYYENATEEFMKLIWKYKVELDGVLLHNNWPLDESFKDHNKTYKVLPYFNENFAVAFNQTPQWNIIRSDGETYMSIHNEYGNFFAEAFKKVSTTPIWSTSHRMNAEVIVNRQNIETSWTNLKKELVNSALGGISGHWLWSSPICGDTENFNRTIQIPLCIKWYKAATYLPMIKIHSKSVRRDPLSFNGTDRVNIMTALNNRLSLMPYFYTTLQEGPLLRPMFYEFPLSRNLSKLDTQFSVGESLIIVPNLEPLQSRVNFWMPPGQWYEIWSGLPLLGTEGEPILITTTEADLLTLIRGGSIVIMQMNTRASSIDTRLTDFSLKVALHCEVLERRITSDCSAFGKLYMAENTTILFEASSRELTISLVGDSTPFCSTSGPIWGRNLEEIDVYGLDGEQNNMDHHRRLSFSPPIELCQLESGDHKIVIDFFTDRQS